MNQSTILIGLLIGGGYLLLKKDKKTQTKTVTAAPILFSPFKKNFAQIFAPYQLKTNAQGHTWWENGFGQPVVVGPSKEAYQQVDLMRKQILTRMKSQPLPAGASPNAGDKYSNLKVSLPNCLGRGSDDTYWKPPYYNPPQCTYQVYDEYGRLWPEQMGGGSSFASGMVYIVKKVAPLVAIAYPPAAPLIYAALAAYDSRGKEFSLKDTALQAARSQVPPEYQFAFDVGVGIASGEDPDEALVNAYLEQYPEARGYYEEGKKLYQQAKQS